MATVASGPQTRCAPLSPSARSAQTSGIPSGIDHAGGIQPAKECRIVYRFHDHVDIGEEKRAGLLLRRAQSRLLLNHLIIAADGYIDPQNGPGGEGMFMRYRWWSQLAYPQEPISRAASGAA